MQRRFNCETLDSPCYPVFYSVKCATTCGDVRYRGSAPLRCLAVIAVLAAATLLAQKIHESDPPAVFKADVTPSIGHCYRLPSPGESHTYFCDVQSPATGQHYAVVIVDRGGISIERK